MKTIPIQIMPATPPGKIVIAAVALILIQTICSNAAQSSTNWSWLNFEFKIPKTNFSVGDKISASTIVSNISEGEHILRWHAGDPCICGPGNFSIIEISSGKAIQCRLSLLQRAGLANSYQAILQRSKFENFESDLAFSYGITNPGTYRVSAVGWFPIIEPPTNHQYAIVETPAIIIQLSSKSETNAAPRSP